MNIKNVFKSIGAVAAAIGGAVVFNNAVFKISKSNDKDFVEGEYYSWKYGKVHYIKKGFGQPILLVHSLYVGSSHREFYKNIDSLSKKYTVYAVDLPGFGYSHKPRITYTAFTYASFLNSFITDVIKTPCGAVGANGGGMLLTVTAKLFPEKITKLVLISPTGVCDKMAENQDLFKRTVMELPLKGTALYNYVSSRKSIKRFLSKEGFFAPHFIDSQVVDNFYFSAHGTNGNARYSYASFASNYMNMDIKDYFRQLSQKIFVVWGEGNNINNIKNMEILKDLNDRASFFIFEETRLLPHVENYEEFNKLIYNDF